MSEENKKVILNSAIIALKTTLGDMPSKYADEIVEAVIKLLEIIKD